MKTFLILILFQISFLVTAQTWSEVGGLNGLGANNAILSICHDQTDNIYAAGAFINSSGNFYVSKWDGTFWTELGGLNPLSADSVINTITTDGMGNIYAGGYFKNTSGKYFVAKWNGSTWSELGGINGLSANGPVWSIDMDNSGNLFAAGCFQNVNGKCYVAKWDGTFWTELGGLNGLSANGGNFTNSSGKDYVAIWDGSNWNELGGLNGLNANLFVSSICIDLQGNIYAAGNFSNSASKRYVARYGLATGINVIKHNSILNFFPNPSSSITYIELPVKLNNAAIKLLDSYGKVISEQKNVSGVQFTFNLSDQPQGIYFVELKESGIIYRGKLVKQ